jgi:acylphosphatase
MERITARAKGRVQGVGYRAYIGDCARATGIHGYVKNLPDGTVEFVAESSPASLMSFLKLAYAKNDSFIRVDEIEVRHGPATGEFSGFRVAW